MKTSISKVLSRLSDVGMVSVDDPIHVQSDTEEYWTFRVYFKKFSKELTVRTTFYDKYRMTVVLACVMTLDRRHNYVFRTETELFQHVTQIIDDWNGKPWGKSKDEQDARKRQLALKELQEQEQRNEKIKNAMDNISEEQKELVDGVVIALRRAGMYQTLYKPTYVNLITEHFRNIVRARMIAMLPVADRIDLLVAALESRSI